MKINKIVIGNNNEAFIEDRFSDGLNIISSDDNNKGKTIVIQSLMYAMGNEPIFPSSFPFQEYYYIIEFEINEEIVKICRKKDTFIVLRKENLFVYDSLQEFKVFLKKYIFNLPVIIKNNYKKIVDPVLFFQIFFVGQDKKNTSTIFNSGYYNKQDFINMIYSYAGIPLLESNQYDQKDINKKIQKLNEEKELLKKENKILKDNTDIANLVNMSSDKEQLKRKFEEIEKIKDEIIFLKNKRSRAINRKLKNEITLKELNSLNQTLSVGSLYCYDCNSVNITYSTKDKNCNFDISSIEIRNQIIKSIEDKIKIYNEEIDEVTDYISQKQLELKALLEVDDVSLEKLLSIKNDIVKASSADSRLLEITNEINNLRESLKIKENVSCDIQEQKKKLYTLLSDKIYEVYKFINPSGNLKFEGLFSKKNDVYSGSEGNEFYLAKMCALSQVLKHNYPIIIDCFRDGEMSSKKENNLLNLLKSFNNQVILTVTLKEEETNKYNCLDYINHIQYDSHEVCNLLNEKFVKDFKNEIQKFAIKL